jgi:hypothetical protein
MITEIKFTHRIKTNKLKLGILLIGIIGITAYTLDDIFYYSHNQLAEVLVLPIATLICLPILVYLVLPYFITRK